MPSVVPMAVSIVTSVWMMIFQVSFFMAFKGAAPGSVRFNC